MKSNLRQMAIVERNDKYISVVLQGNDIDQVFVDDTNTATLRVGDIYIGKVKNIIPNINAAFVEVGKGVMCYLPLKGNAGKKIQQEQEIPVQVKKAAVKTKQAVVSTKFEFPGKYAVITTENLSKTMSSKIMDAHIRQSLEELLHEWQEEPLGIVLRTSCKTAPIDAIRQECTRLLAQAREVVEHALWRTCYSRVYQAQSEYVQYVMQTEGERLQRIITDQKEVLETLQMTLGTEDERISYYEDTSYSLDALLGISVKLDKLLAKHVWLKSGGSLVIEHTEALTVIDVNTQKAIAGKRNQETTFLKINREAAREAARQIRARNLSGIILIDFIDMKEKAHEEELLLVLEEELSKDQVRTTIVDITKLGLVELTRMKVRKPLRECL